MKKYLEVSEIKETDTNLKAEEMVKEILSDFEILLSFMVETAEAASEIDDLSTEDMMIAYMKRTEKMHWMLTSFITKE